ncbi:MAG: hypothetical protein ACE5GZ_06580 [Gammaproteobacteria bacterium]
MHPNKPAVVGDECSPGPATASGLGVVLMFSYGETRLFIGEWFLPQAILAVFLFLAVAGGTTRAAPAPEMQRSRQPVLLPAEIRGEQSVADFWRAIRDSERGYVAGPKSQSGILIVDWPKDCAKAGNCTERAVGFTLPIHDLMPAIREPEGQGVRRDTVLFVLVLFGALILAGMVFVYKLGAGVPGDPEQREG